MKIKIFSISVCLYFSITSLINASQEMINASQRITNPIYDIHETQKQSIRKQGIHIEYTNFESNFVSFDVRQDGRFIKTIKHKIHLNQKKDLNKRIIEQFFANQFDTIKITKDNLFIVLPNNQDKVPYNNGIFWCNSNLTLEHYSANLKNYLNKCLTTSTQTLLEVSLQKRSALNPNIDKYENRGLTDSELQPMMENCYAIGIHVPELKGAIDIKEVTSENGEKNPVRKYQSKLSIVATANLLIYRLDNNLKQFVEYHSENVECSQFPLIIETDSIEETVDYKILNKNNSVFDTIFNELSIALGASSMRLSQSCFPIGMVITKVKGTILESRGIPDIRIDAPFYVRSRIDGVDKYTGWGKTRSVASIHGDPLQVNKYRLISGKAKERSLGEVHPWMGIAGYVAIGHDESGGKSDLNENYKKIQFGTYGDLGYVLNQKSFSEWWIEIGGSYGYCGLSLEDEDFDVKYYALNFNIYKRLYLSPIGLYNFFVAPGAGVEYRRTNIIRKYSDVETDNLIAKAIVNVGYSFSPDHELFLSFGYNEVFNGFGDYEGEDKILNESVADDSGLVIQFGYAFYLSKIAGGIWNPQYNTTP